VTPLRKAAPRDKVTVTDTTNVLRGSSKVVNVRFCDEKCTAVIVIIACIFSINVLPTQLATRIRTTVNT
jgi:hypothetical protein